MSIVKSYILFFNSENRNNINDDSDYCSYILKTPIVLQSKEHYFTCRLLTACIPYSFKQLDAFNVSGTYTHNLVTTPISVNIPSGNYSILTLLQEFNDRLANISYPHAVSFKFTYDATNGFASLSVISNQSYTFNFNYNGFWKALGFVSSSVLTISNSIVLTSARHVNVHPTNRIYIRSDSLTQPQGSYEWILEESVDSDIIANIPIEGSPNSWILYDSASSPTIQLTNETINQITLYLSSNVHYELSLGNLDWTCSLEITERVVPKYQAPTFQSMVVAPSVEPAVAPEIQQELAQIKAELENDIQQKVQKKVSKYQSEFPTDLKVGQIVRDD